MKEEIGVTDYQLEEKCTPEHLKKIVKDVGNYSEFASKFGIPPGHLANITKDDHLNFLQKTEAIFLWWCENNLTPLYRVFVQICIDLGKGDLARKMCKLCAKGTSYTDNIDSIA